MGALTLKSFPFELRGWDIEKFESLDPTDGFGSNTRVYINKNQIIQIEPDFNIYTFNSWLTDKGRQFFDSLFESQTDNSTKNVSFWYEMFNAIIKTTYIFDHCNKQVNKNHFFTIVFDHLSIETVSMLMLINNSYPFLKLRYSESLKINNNFESNLKLNNVSNRAKLNSSSLCLLISTNPRYEGYYLNLNLRQRSLKGEFKCLTLGSLVDLTFPIYFLGSNIKIIQSITEGNNFSCQDIKFAKNPLLVYNYDLFKRNDSKNLDEILKKLFSTNILKKTWNGFNVLSSSLSSSSLFNLNLIEVFNFKDFINFNTLYFLNIKTNNIFNFKKITESKLIKFIINSKNYKFKNKIIIDQNANNQNNSEFFKKISSNHFYIPTSTFYENEETFINTEGFIKRTTKLLLKKEKSNWQILRKFLKYFKNKLTFLTQKNCKISFYNCKNLYNFKTYMSFKYHSIQSLTNLNFYLNIKNKTVIFNKNLIKFKIPSNKIVHSKLKYWLDDFFNGGKDEYSQNSLILTSCSKNLRSESSTFF